MYPHLEMSNQNDVTKATYLIGYVIKKRITNKPIFNKPRILPLPCIFIYECECFIKKKKKKNYLIKMAKITYTPPDRKMILEFQFTKRRTLNTVHITLVLKFIKIYLVSF
jgi:hypothetical protein